MSSTPQENVDILPGLSDKSDHYRPSPLPQFGGRGRGEGKLEYVEGKDAIVLENLSSQQKGDGTDKAGEDHSPRNVHDDHDEGPVLDQRKVRQLISLISNETKEQAQENRLCKRSGLDCRGYHKYDQAEKEEKIKENRCSPKDLAS